MATPNDLAQETRIFLDDLIRKTLTTESTALFCGLCRHTHELQPGAEKTVDWHADWCPMQDAEWLQTMWKEAKPLTCPIGGIHNYQFSRPLGIQIMLACCVKCLDSQVLGADLTWRPLGEMRDQLVKQEAERQLQWMGRSPLHRPVLMPKDEDDGS